MTYDLAAASGTYDDKGYSEIHVGLNTYFTSWLNWRNAAFIRTGSEIDSTLGLDTSFRYEMWQPFEAKRSGLHMFAGPGYRIASEHLSGFFVEGGVITYLSGFGIGFGLKSIFYSNPGKNSAGQDLSSTDTVLAIILAIAF